MQDRHKSHLVPAFNQLSGIGRLTLRTAVMMTSITRIGREDTLRHRAFFIPYALPVGFALLPIPIPGTNVASLGLAAIGVGGWAWLGLTESARRNKEELIRDFSHAAIMENYKTMIMSDPQKPNRFALKKADLSLHILKTMGRDSWAATTHFFRPVKNLF